MFKHLGALCFSNNSIDKKDYPIYYQGKPISKVGGDILEKGKGKRGPKTDNPKPYVIGVKLDQESKDILDSYCEQENVSKMEATRRGIKRLKPDLKSK